MRKSEFNQVERMKKGRGRPTITLGEVGKKDMSILEVTKSLTFHRID